MLEILLYRIVLYMTLVVIRIMGIVRAARDEKLILQIVLIISIIDAIRAGLKLSVRDVCSREHHYFN